MIHEIIELKDYYPINTDAYLEVIIPYNDDNLLRKKSPGIIIVPGGGYSFVSIREADPVAFSFASEGFLTFVLHYSIKTCYPTPMLELAYSIDYLRKNADKYYLDKDKLGIIGFSAGGHLVTSYGYLYEHSDFKKNININSDQLRPNFIIASYPVITMKEQTHMDTRKNITSLQPELIKLLSVEDNITTNYPPTFVWTTLEDACVPPENTMMYIKALKDNNIKHDYYIYPYLDHGLSILNPLVHERDFLLTNKAKDASLWFNKAVNFINQIIKK